MQNKRFIRIVMMVILIFGGFVAGLGYPSGMEAAANSSNSFHWSKTFDSYANPKFYSQNIYMYRLDDVAYNGKVYVAVGDNGIVQLSYDGKVWKDIHISHLPGNGNLEKVIWDGKMFFIISNHKSYLVSKDGTNWSLRTFSKDYTYFNLVYTGGKHLLFVNGEMNPSKNIEWGSGDFPYVSIDGLNWKKGNYKNYQYHGLMVAQWNGKKFLGAGVGGTLAESKDGMNWTILNNLLNYGFDVTNLLWNGKTFVSAGSNRVIVSSDGSKWNSIFTMKNAQFTDIAWNGKKYAMIVQHSKYDNKLFKNLVTDTVIYTSTNLKNWAPEYQVKNPYPNRWNDSKGRERYLSSIKWTGKSFVAIGTEIVEGK